MVDITCVRCGASETGFATAYTANFGLVHERGCGTKIGVSKYSNFGDKVTSTTATTETTQMTVTTETPKPKPKKSFFKKKKKKKRDD